MSLSFILWLFWFYLVERWDFCLTLKQKYSYYYLINSCCITHAISSNVFVVETGLYITDKIVFFYFGSSQHISNIRSQEYQKYSRFIEINYLIFDFVSKFKFHTPIWFEAGLHSWRKSLLQDRSDFSKRFEVSISLFHFYLFSLSYLKHISSIGIQWIESRVFGFYILLLFILGIEQHCKPNNITTKTHLRG